MAKAGLPTPRNSRINAPEDVVPAGEHVGFPAVIKPVSGGRAGWGAAQARSRRGWGEGRGGAWAGAAGPGEPGM
jgi:glutathione synthase/RimK-type ligase-like ATP-grasp enzyme